MGALTPMQAWRPCLNPPAFPVMGVGLSEGYLWVSGETSPKGREVTETSVPPSQVEHRLPLARERCLWVPESRQTCEQPKSVWARRASPQLIILIGNCPLPEPRFKFQHVDDKNTSVT